MGCGIVHVLCYTDQLGVRQTRMIDSHNFNMQADQPSPSPAAAAAASAPGIEVKEMTDAESVKECSKGMGLLLNGVDAVHDRLDALYQAIEEFKDPNELMRTAQHVKDTPVTTEAQFDFIQYRLQLASTDLSTVRVLVGEWMAQLTNATKRGRKTMKQQRTQKCTKTREPVKELDSACGICNRRANKEDLIPRYPDDGLNDGRPSYFVCSRCIERRLI